MPLVEKLYTLYFLHMLMDLHNGPLLGPSFIVIQQNLKIRVCVYMCIPLGAVAASTRRVDTEVLSSFRWVATPEQHTPQCCVHDLVALGCFLQFLFDMLP